jgi:hypothetical protein
MRRHWCRRRRWRWRWRRKGRRWWVEKRQDRYRLCPSWYGCGGHTRKLRDAVARAERRRRPAWSQRLDHGRCRRRRCGLCARVTLIGRVCLRQDGVVVLHAFDFILSHFFCKWGCLFKPLFTCFMSTELTIYVDLSVQVNDV